MYFMLLHLVGKRSGVARFQRALAGAIALQRAKQGEAKPARYLEKQFSMKCISIAQSVENTMFFRYVSSHCRDRKSFCFCNNGLL